MISRVDSLTAPISTQPKKFVVAGGVFAGTISGNLGGGLQGFARLGHQELQARIMFSSKSDVSISSEDRIFDAALMYGYTGGDSTLAVSILGGPAFGIARIEDYEVFDTPPTPGHYRQIGVTVQFGLQLKTSDLSAIDLTGFTTFGPSFNYTGFLVGFSFGGIN